ncbi:interleukin-4 receptor subunit alpha [Liasis olivaceus]
MAARRTAAAGLLCLLWHLASSEHGQPSCHTDFETELVCHWEVDAITNCTTEFKLLYRAESARQLQECVPKNERGPGAASHCVAIILGLNYRIPTYYLVLVRTENRAKVWNVTLDMGLITKPRPLIHLTAGKGKDRTFILTWKRDYNTEILCKAKAKYEVAYWPKNHTEMKLILPEVLPHHKIFADKLHPGSTYEASVRYKLTLWDGTWSEWSATCEWLNVFWHQNFTTMSISVASQYTSNGTHRFGEDIKCCPLEATGYFEPEKESWTFIPWLCFVVIALILSCYLSSLWVKRKWWDEIPSPAKSKMVEDMTAGKLFSVFGMMETAAEHKTVPCDSRRRQLQSKGGADLPHQPTRANWEPFLIPEVSLIDGSLTTCSSAVDIKQGSPEEEEEEEEEEMDHIPHEDALAGLFRDLLCVSILSTGDLGPTATFVQRGCTAPEKCDCLEGFSQPVYQGCSMVSQACESSGPEHSHPSTLEARANWLPGLESSPGAPSGTIMPGRASPQAKDESEGGTAAPSAPGYKSISSLEAQAGSSFSQAWQQWPCLPQGGQTQAQGSPGPSLLPPGTEPLLGAFGRFPAGQDSLSLYGAATETWLLPPQQGTALEASALLDLGRPGSLSGPKASLLSGYRSFSCALQNSVSSQDFCLESPYKAFLSSVPLDPSLEAAQALGSPAWPNAPWGWVGTDL